MKDGLDWWVLESKREIPSLADDSEFDSFNERELAKVLRAILGQSAFANGDSSDSKLLAGALAELADALDNPKAPVRLVIAKPANAGPGRPVYAGELVRNKTRERDIAIATFKAWQRKNGRMKPAIFDVCRDFGCSSETAYKALRQAAVEVARLQADLAGLTDEHKAELEAAAISEDDAALTTAEFNRFADWLEAFAGASPDIEG